MEEREPDLNSPSRTNNGRIKLNVGGKLFETTGHTLRSGGLDSLLAALSDRAAEDGEPIFIDRDPEIFSILLSLLRSDRLPSTSRRFSKQDLVEEAQYYGIEGRLRTAMAPPPLLGFDAALAATIRPASDGFPTALSAGSEDGSVWIAHAGQISAYDWSLAHAGTVRTHLDQITSLRHVWPEIAGIGSLDSPGLHFYDVTSGRHVGSAHWSDPSDPRVYKARVTAIAAAAGAESSGEPVFAAFECPHRENCILAVDRATLKIAGEIGRQNGSAAKAAAAGKLVHVRERGVVFAAAVSVGAFGYSGYMRLWDPRSGEAVWETSEPGGAGRSTRFGDAFADADVDVDTEGQSAPAIYKVCWKTGDVGMADMRMLGDDPWVYLEERSPGLRNAGGGLNSVLHCYKGQVFVSREGGLEVWSRIEDDEEEEDKDGGISGRRYRRNFVDSEDDARRGLVKRMEGGGNRLFVSRERVEGIEVWESSDLSGAISLL
ncbi:protein ENDOPLASMIC RETICULUM-ARRESTED PEN3 [Elaeis guineensis]|uniref:BTB/POZ domain-containing protein At3g09030 n=1 Tax=Elaeis guineensis var. tenera TaxID=51953 RepID=A0A6I9RBF7_ELAGV|nr:BTB/POZ domain-containing protein At3g09030 [Elaeis guineensis]XP_010923097.1 BTB/POZ domain-containing protein At3g09030 [Elaeis guineensis]XP_010923098.1 BTB/POZ domain-containing protein At3g09030 [Elaeis guineensis]